jgi:DNA polymerase elongation subunit (family B)
MELDSKITNNGGEVKQPIFLIYDIETFLSIFCVVFKYQGRYKTFEISERKDEYESLVAFLKEGASKGWFFVGFNNARFDAQVLQWLIEAKEPFKKLTGKTKAKHIMEFAQSVIEKINRKEFPPYQESKLSFQQLDLYLQHHYNNLARKSSLKWLEYSMNWNKIQDLPYKFDEVLSSDKFDDVIKYCINDVDATEQFFKKSKQLVELRFAQQSENMHLELFNKSDSSIGEALFLDLMSDKLQVEKKHLKKMQTRRETIELKNVILSYIKFETPEFNSVLEFFKEQIITESTKDAFKHSMMFDGMEYFYGLGGLHAARDNSIFKSNEENIVLSVDFASFYPNISIRNRLYPEHLSEAFCILYEELFEKRKLIPKSNPQNTAIKLLLNSCFGKAGDEHSFLYDKKFQMAITVNGQLILSMLCEQLSKIEGVRMVMANTDGCELIVPKNKKREVYNVCLGIEKLTQLQLEYAVYDKLFTRDINNYLGIETNGKIKTKGCFDIDLELHKNRSERIVPIAIKRYFVDDIPVEETIKNHLSVGDYDKIENQGIYDFCIGKKIQSNQNYTIEDSENNIVKNITDKVIRFYVSTDGNYLRKNYSDGRKEITVGGNTVTMFMDYYDSENYNIDYDYYVNQAYKIIHNVDGTTQRLEQEAKEKREQIKLEKEEENYLKFIINKTPTELQYKTYWREHCALKYGEPKEIKQSKAKS